MTCRICHRPLTDPESVARGIGPTCRAHRRPEQWSLFDGREPKGVEDGQDGQVRSETSPTPRFQMVAEDLETRPYRVVDGAPMVVVDFDAARGLRAPWWRRVWQWVRGWLR